MKYAFPIFLVLLLSLGYASSVALAPEEFLQSGATSLDSGDTAVSKVIDFTDSTGTETITLACMGPGHFVVYAYVRAGGSWSGYLRLDSVSTATGLVTQYSITRDSLMNVRLPDGPWNAGVSVLKRWPKYFSYRLVLRARGTGAAGVISLYRG